MVGPMFTYLDIPGAQDSLKFAVENTFTSGNDQAEPYQAMLVASKFLTKDSPVFEGFNAKVSSLIAPNNLSFKERERS